MMKTKHDKAFTLIELLVVISVIAVMMAILLPALSAARQQAKVLAVNSDLYQVSLGLEMYMENNNGKHPPTRKDCSMGWEDRQLPPELAQGKYLPAPKPKDGTTAGIKDRFHRINTYKYSSVGDLYQNNRFMPYIKASLYVPASFPDNQGPPHEDIRYDDPKTSPVTWVVYSQGPELDEWKLIKQLHGPVPKRTWYSPSKKQGLIVRMRLRGGGHLGSFDK
jgi:prepilin-type N-terminal cleavage/methylation domain-containing protein